MSNKPIIIVNGEPHSIFLEIFFKSLKYGRAFTDALRLAETAQVTTADRVHQLLGLAFLHQGQTGLGTDTADADQQSEQIPFLTHRKAIEAAAVLPLHLMNPQVQILVSSKALLVPLCEVHLVTNPTANQQNAATVSLSPVLQRSSLQPADHGERFQPRHVAAAVIACVRFEAFLATASSDSVCSVDAHFADGLQWISASTCPS